MNNSRSSESGNTILVSVVTMAILGSFVALAVDYTSNVGRNAQRDRVFNTAVEIGDGAISQAFAGWRETCKTSSTPNPPTTAFAAIPTPSPGNFPNYTTAVLTNFQVQAVDPLVTLAQTSPAPVSSLATTATPPPATGPGTGTFSYFYLASVDVTLPAMKGTLTAKVRRIFEKRYTSPWNWAMMYSGDLELHPSSRLTLNGWVHSNQNVYVGNGTTDSTVTPASNLTLSDRLSYQGNYTIGFHAEDTFHSGQVNVASPTTDADLPPGHEQYYSLFGWDSSKFDTTDSNANNDGYHELIERAATGTDAFTGQRLYDQAAIAVTIDASNNVKVYQGVGATKSDVTGQSNSGAGGTAATTVAASVATNKTFYDGREGGMVRVVDFDVAKFVQTYASNSYKSWNGIIYLTDTSGSATTKRAIRVINGAKLPTGGMTIASDNPVYIKGDFNTGRTTTAEPPSNTGNPANPEASGYAHRPASIMADAVTLLSNSWNDTNATGVNDITTRPASNTTVNAALVAGNVPTTGGVYSGGGENFVRFLEDWSGKSFTYYGSMICPYASTQGKGNWGSDNVFAPPTQNWNFDTSLSVDSSGNPVSVPGYVSTVAYLQQQRWYLQY